MSKTKFFRNIFNQISGLSINISKYIFSKMRPIHNTSKNDKFTSCWCSLNSTINLIIKVLVDSDIITYYPKPKLRNLLQNAFYFLNSINSKTIFLMK